MPDACPTPAHLDIPILKDRFFEKPIQKSAYIKIKILWTVTLKIYENLVYCNLAAVLPFFSVQQITDQSDENYRSELEMKSCLNNI